jgi:hypothetical protein
VTTVLSSVADVFPVDTTVGAYLARYRRDGAAPSGSATTTAVVAASGALAFGGLADDTDYVAYALVGSAHKYKSFQTTRPRTTGEAIIGPVVDGQAPVWSDTDSAWVATPVTTRAQVLRNGAANRAFTDELSAPVTPRAPALSWSNATSFTSDFSGTEITDHVHVPFTDERLKWIGGSPVAYTSAGYGSSLGGVSRVKYDDSLTTFDVLSFMCFDFEGDYFELPLRGDSDADYRLWIDGRPHATAPVECLPSGGTTGSLYLLRVQFASRALRQIKVEMQRGLTGGVLIGPTDTLSTPAGAVVGDGVLCVGDSYAGGANIGPSYGWPLRFARRLGLDNLYICNVGGRGVNVDTALNGSTTGRKYRSNLIAERTLIPDDLRLIVIQGSTNDGNYSVSTSSLRAALATELTALLDYCVAQWPNAQIVMTSTLRCADPTANDITASGIYETVCDARDDVLYIDQIADEWFNGTGTSAAPAGDGNADWLIQTDASHPTITGAQVQGDRLAAECASVIPSQSPTPTVAGRQFARRSDSQAYGSDTLENDTVLQVGVAADCEYKVTALLRYESTTAADFEAGFYGPSGAELLWGVGGAKDQTLSDTLQADGSGADVTNLVLVEGILVTDAAGTFGVKAGQDTLSVVNLFANPTLEAGNTGLTISQANVTGGTLSNSTDWAEDGTHSAKITGTTSAAGGYVGVQIIDGASVFAVTAATGYKFQCRINVTEPCASGYGTYAVIYWYNGVTAIGSDLGTLGTLSSGERTLEVTGVAPATADGARVFVLSQSGTNADLMTFYIDSVVFASVDTYLHAGSFLSIEPVSA